MERLTARTMTVLPGLREEDARGSDADEPDPLGPKNENTLNSYIQIYD